jgi:hypothetical protein
MMMTIEYPSSCCLTNWAYFPCLFMNIGFIKVNTVSQKDPHHKVMGF